MQSSAVGGRQVARATPCSLQPREQVVGVQHRGLRGVAQPVGAERADVGVGAHEAAVVALEAAQPADRLRPCRSRGRTRGSSRRRSAPPRRTITGAAGTGRCARTPRSGPSPGPPPPWGWVKDLCRLKWTMSKPMSPGPRDAHHRVEVRAVVVERRADPVHDPSDLLDVRVEQAERVRVGQHQAGDVARRPSRAGRRGRRRRRRWCASLTTS